MTREVNAAQIPHKQASTRATKPVAQHKRKMQGGFYMQPGMMMQQPMMMGQPGMMPGMPQIVSAQYGANNMWNDVTMQFSQFAMGKGQNIPGFNYNSVFGDPLVGVRKQLRVTFMANGMQSMVTTWENEPVNLIAQGGMMPMQPMMPPMQPPMGMAMPMGMNNVQILNAQYGAHHQWTDVTMQLAQYVAGKGNHIPEFNYNSVFGDPMPGVNKKLKVTFLHNGKEGMIEEPENHHLHFKPREF